MKQIEKDMESWRKEKIMSLSNDELLVYVNHMLANGWSMGKLQELTGVRRQTLRDRLKKDGYIYNSEANAYLKPLLEQEISDISVKVSESPRKTKKKDSVVITLESLNERVEALEMRINDISVVKSSDKIDFELIRFKTKEQPRNYPLYQEVIDLLSEVHSNNKHLKMKDIVNNALYAGLLQMKNSKDIE